MAHDNKPSSILEIVKAARKGRLGQAVRTAARNCTSRADRRFQKKLHTVENAIKKMGWNARCFSRSITEPDSIYWPAREVAILVDVTDFETEAGYVEEVLSIGKST